MTGTLKSIKLVRLTNTGTTSCTLSGYPDIRSFTSQGQPVPLDFGHSPQTFFGAPLAVTTVTLRPQGTARVIIGVDYYACGGQQARPGRVVLTLPGDPDPLRLAAFGPDALCRNSGVWASPVFGDDVNPYQQPS